MGEIEWSKEQKKVIDQRNANLLVAAAAGSGKTAVLVERIIQMVLDNNKHVDIDRLLVVTFTKAAAAEMKNRVSEALEEALDKRPSDTRLARQLTLVNTAQIMTIDSFCQNIIKNYFHVIDLDPEFRVADADEIKIIKNDVVKKILEEQYHEYITSKNDQFIKFTEAFSTGKNDKDIEQIILNLYEKSQTNIIPEEWLKDILKIYDEGELCNIENSIWLKEIMKKSGESIDGILKIAEKALNICLEKDGPDAYRPAIESDIMQLKRIKESKTYDEFYRNINSYSPLKLGRVSAKDGVDEDKKNQVKNYRDTNIKKEIANLCSKYFIGDINEEKKKMNEMGSYIAEMVRVTLEFTKRFTEKKRKEGLIDFNDMEHLALDILTVKDGGRLVPSRVAQELREYYQEVMIDEYQDSNFVQDTILSSITDIDNGPYMFMVGDVKQSIYSFRQAKPQLFIEKYNRYSKDEGKEIRIDLHKNFRSRANVLENVNYIFERIMRKSFGGIDYDEDAALVPGADYTINSVDKILEPQDIHIENVDNVDKSEIILINADIADDDDEESAEASLGVLEATAIGEEILKMMDNNSDFVVVEKKTCRRVRYSDIVILHRSPESVNEAYYETLTDMGIPVYTDSKKGYFKTIEVQTVLNYLRIIDNPRQDIPLAAVMRSWAGEFSNNELAEVGICEAGINYYDKIKEYIEKNINGTLTQKLYGFLEELEELRRKSKSESVYDLLNDIYYNKGYYDIVSVMPAGERRKSNLDILRQKALVFSEEGNKSIFSFVYYIENLNNSKVDYGEANINSENTNAVRIMSIHKSKGLEFPVVFLGGMCKQFNLKDSNATTLFDADYGIGSKYIDLDLRIKQDTIFRRFISDHIKESSVCEEQRLLYVALTRAKEKLYIVGAIKKLSNHLKNSIADMEIGFSSVGKAKCYFDWIIPVVMERSIIKNAINEYRENEMPQSVQDELLKLSIKNRSIVSMITDKLSDQDIETAELSISGDVNADNEAEGKSDAKSDAKSEENVQISLDKYPEEVNINDMAAEGYKNEAKRLIDKLIRQSQYTYPFTPGVIHPEKISVSDIKRMHNEEIAALSDEVIVYSENESKDVKNVPDESVAQDSLPAFMRNTSVESSIPANVRGTLYHKAFEKIPFDKENVDFDVYKKWLVDNNFMNSRENEEIDAKLLQKLYDSELGQRMRKACMAGKLYREQPFMISFKTADIFKDSENDEGQTIVQGVIDVFFEEDGKIILVDYKTDKVKEGDEHILAERYGIQFDYYSMALERLTGKKVTERYIYSVALSKAIKE